MDQVERCSWDVPSQQLRVGVVCTGMKGLIKTESHNSKIARIFWDEEEKKKVTDDGRMFTRIAIAFH